MGATAGADPPEPLRIWPRRLEGMCCAGVRRSHCLTASGCPGVVEVVAKGAGLRVEPLAEEALEERGRRLVIPASGAIIDDDTIRSLRK